MSEIELLREENRELKRKISKMQELIDCVFCWMGIGE